jgi:hypothetical protein
MTDEVKKVDQTNITMALIITTITMISISGLGLIAILS